MKRNKKNTIGYYRDRKPNKQLIRRGTNWKLVSIIAVITLCLAGLSKPSVGTVNKDVEQALTKEIVTPEVKQPKTKVKKAKVQNVRYVAPACAKQTINRTCNAVEIDWSKPIFTGFSKFGDRCVYLFDADSNTSNLNYYQCESKDDVHSYRSSDGSEIDDDKMQDEILK